MLTARDAVDDRVRLDVGADDYLVKPFALAELLARLRALLRRRFEGEGAVLRFEDLSLDSPAREARGERPFELTRIEFDLLELFLRHPRQVLTRDEILDRVWGYTSTRGPTPWPSTLATFDASSRRPANRADPDGARRGLRASRHVTFRSRLVPVMTVAVVLAVLAASAAPFCRRHTLLHSLVSSLATAAQSILSGEDFRVDDSQGRAVDRRRPAARDGGRSARDRPGPAVAADLAPSFFTTVTLDGNDLREYVEHLPAGTLINEEPFVEGGALQSPRSRRDYRAPQLGLSWSWSPWSGPAGVRAGWLVGRTALVPLDALTDPSKTSPRRPHSRRLEPGGSDELGRLRRTFNRLLAALDRAPSAEAAGARRRTRAADAATSLRTNLEVIRRLEELSAGDRAVLVDDLLPQLQELTDLVGDLSELARGDRGRRPG